MNDYYNVRDLIYFTTKGIAPSYVNSSDVIVLNQKCIRNNKIDYSFAQYHDVAKTFTDSKKVEIGDILINSTGQGTAGRCAFVTQLPSEKTVIVDSHILIVRVDDFYTAGCLSYGLFSVERLLQSFLDGSTGQGEFDKQRLFNIILRLPHEKERQAVYLLLNKIDQKIELNNRINAELEAMAKTLYDYWFVQFDFPNEEGKPYKSSGGKMVYNSILKREIPVMFSEGVLDNLGQIVGGSTPDTKDCDNFCIKGVPWITPNDLSNNQGNKYISKGEKNVSDKGIKSASLKKYPLGTVLLTSRAPIGYMAIARKEFTTNQGFKSFIPNKEYPTDFVYFTIKNSLSIIIQFASGSTFKEISTTVLKTVPIVLPPLHIVKDFTNKIDSLTKQQNILEQECSELRNLRDWLLPMLMNGQVTVK